MTLAVRDPLVRPKRRLSAEGALTLVFLAAAAMLHGAVIATAFVAGTAFARFQVAPVYEEVEVAVLEEIAEPEPEPEPEPEQKPIEAPKPKKAKPPPPDPVNLEPPREKPKVEPRRIVGVNLESTVEGGGPAFAAGNTRMGKTERIAEAPEKIEPLPKPAEKVLPNRTATRVPTAGKSVVKPKPIGGMRDAPYPELYKAQGLEADVTVRVRIDRTGRVIEAEVVSPAPQPEFNRAAKETAEAQKFEPALRDGVPIEWTITFTYHFRLVD